jgi:hypothetical protein
MEIEIKKEETSLAVAQEVKDTGLSMWNDRGTLNYMFKFATELSKSELVPQSYQNKPANVMIAWDMGNRMNVSPLWVMQNSCIVRGKFGWSGQACKALIDGCGKFSHSRFVEVGERGKDTWGYYLEAVEKGTGEVVKGTAVTMQLAKEEGWLSNSKWKSMSEQMLKYRCASFFARTECPNVLGGYQTAEELEDVDMSGYQGARSGSLRELLDEEIKGE